MDHRTDAPPLCLAAVESQHACLHEWQFTGDSGTAQLTLLLLPDPQGSPTKGTDAFTLVGAAGRHPSFGELCVTDKSSLSYTVTHHNLEDSATVVHGGFELAYQEGTAAGSRAKTFHLRVRRQSDSQVVLDTPLEKTGCAPKGSDASLAACLACRSKCCS